MVIISVPSLKLLEGLNIGIFFKQLIINKVIQVFETIIIDDFFSYLTKSWFLLKVF